MLNYNYNMISYKQVFYVFMFYLWFQPWGILYPYRPNWQPVKLYANEITVGRSTGNYHTVTELVSMLKPSSFRSKLTLSNHLSALSSAVCHFWKLNLKLHSKWIYLRLGSLKNIHYSKYHWRVSSEWTVCIQFIYQIYNERPVNM